MVSSEAEEMCQPSHGVVIKRCHTHINTRRETTISHVHCIAATSSVLQFTTWLHFLFMREAQSIDS